MITWMLYIVIVGLCTVVAAWSADGLARRREWPTRFVWIGAAALSLVLAATAPIRAHATPALGQRVDLSSIALVQTSIETVEQHVPTSVVWYVAGLWGIATVLTTLSFIVAHTRLRRARRTWPVAELQGYRVRLAPATGPIVIGVVRPEIVVPRWVLSRSPDEQRVILIHESAHVRAGDHILLSVACALVALAPWNPALWIILSRLRLAIEIDCDARVLRSGVSPRSYGSLLVDVAESTSPHLLGAIALADGASHLHQRILAMQPRRSRHSVLRTASVAAVGLASLVAACEAKMPAAADVDQMDATSAARSARALGMLPDSSVIWSIDGVASTDAAAKQIPRDSIVSVEVNKSDGISHIFIRTKMGKATGVVTVNKSIDTPRQRSNTTRDSLVLAGTMQPSGIQAAEPLLLIDGVRSDMAGLKTMDRTRIDKVEVLKGALAVETYGAEARNGVIVVTTKSATTR